MAKKQRVRKGPKRGTNARGTKKKAAPKPKPRQAILPGHERVRSATLDVCCEKIGDIRDRMAQLRKDEAGQKTISMKEMKAKGYTSYVHARVELARVPGEEKLRVRTSKQDADDEGGDAPTTKEGADVETIPDVPPAPFPSGSAGNEDIML